MLTKHLFFVSAAWQARMAPKACRATKQLSVIESLQAQVVRDSRKTLACPNTLKKYHHIIIIVIVTKIISPIINLAYTLQFPIER